MPLDFSLAAFFVFVSSSFGLGAVSDAGSGASSGVEISSRYFFGNILFSKSLKTFSLAPRNNPR